jgi:hypothetical protein
MNSERPKSSRPSRFPIAMAAAIPAFMGCSAPSEHPSSDVPYSPPTTGQQVVNSVAHGSCDEGAERKCSVILGKYEGIVSCFVGVQYCADSVWGPCQDPNGVVAPSAAGAGGQGAGGSGGVSGDNGGAASGGSGGAG